MFCPEKSDGNHTVTGLTIPEEKKPHLHRCEELNTQAAERGHQNGYAEQTVFGLVKTTRNLLYIRNQSVPRCKHFLSRL
jgi:hypothetical protein